MRILIAGLVGSSAALLMAQAPLESLAGAGTAGFGVPMSFPGALRGGIYETPGELSKLPDFNRTLRVASIYTNALRVESRPFWEGFPGLVEPQGAFALDYRADFKVRTTRDYRFSLLSSDGSRLYIDGKLLIDNDGVHDAVEKQALLPLLSGIHQIRVSYFHRARKPAALVLRVAEGDAAGGGEFRLFDTNEFGAPSNSATAEADPPATVRMFAASSRHDPDAARLRLGDALLRNSDAAAALAADPKPRQFEFRVGVIQFHLNLSIWLTSLVIEVPVDQLTVQSGRVQVALLGLVKDDADEVVDRLVFDGSREAGPGASLITWTQPLRLEPKVYTVEVALVDKQTGRVSTAATTMNPGAVPVPGLAMSDMVLVRALDPGPVRRGDPLVHQGSSVVPQLTDRYPASANPSLFFVVYPDATSDEKAVMEIEYSVNGKVLARRSSDVGRPPPGEAMAFTLEPKVHDGNCEMRVTITQGKQFVKGVARFTAASKSDTK